jgi:hypothetical protein
MSDLEAELKTFESLPPPTSCRLIDFTKAEVVPGFVNNTWFLIVSGTKSLSVKVELHALIYIRQPEYWGIEVIGCRSGGITPPLQVPYTVSLDVSHLRGTKGVEVIGAHSRQTINIP